MAKLTLNIAKAYDDGFIENLEKTKYFQLHKNAATRAELFCFAMALCEMENEKPTSINSIGPIKTFARTESLTSCDPLFSSLYFDKMIKENPDSIDELCNRDEVYNFVETYANTGFRILQKYTESIDEETLFYKLIGYMNKKFETIQDELSEML